MDRKYNTVTSSSAIFFVGDEVEHTPAIWKRTLFVNGLHSPEKIIDYSKENFCDHIYFGANQSFIGSNLLTWDAVIKACLAENFWCTLDFDVQYIEDIHETGLCEFNKFIPQVSVKIPYIKLLNYNATLKIDDIGFDATNPGVWCHRVHDLMDSKKFTNWEEYGSDKIIEAVKASEPVKHTSHSISISSYEVDGQRIYQGSVAEFPGLVVEGTDINFVYDELHKEIAILMSREC
jgi:hypothetical protein